MKWLLTDRSTFDVMRIAQRAQRIEPFYVMEVAKAAATMAKEFAHTAKPMIFLNIGEPNFTAIWFSF